MHAELATQGPPRRPLLHLSRWPLHPLSRVFNPPQQVQRPACSICPTNTVSVVSFRGDFGRLQPEPWGGFGHETHSVLSGQAGYPTSVPLSQAWGGGEGAAGPYDKELRVLRILFTA